ncbi:hypothetical protein ACSXCO_09705 [Clostridium perfringens]|uniref:hypothetical protein n=1 Tax=Clostridium perfringens TaxID=1502 RepID=UPI0024BD0439|nr:hypothetical protein [Clostridium perfringens]
MEIDIQTEYNIRTYINNLNDEIISTELSKLLKEEFKLISKYELVCYSLIFMENEFKIGSLSGDIQHKSAASSRVILEWFIKYLLGLNIKRKKFVFKQKKYDKFKETIPQITIIYMNFLMNDKFRQHRGINKIRIEKNDENEYYFIDTNIKDDIDCQETYFWGEHIGIEQLNNERNSKLSPGRTILKKYLLGRTEISVNDFFLFKVIDNEIYSCCKEAIKVDIDKIGSGFNSVIFKNKEIIINVLAAFFYISTVYIFNNEILSMKQVVFCEEPIIFSRIKLLNILLKFGDFNSDELNNIIDYLTIKTDVSFGVNEYPLVNVDDFIMWIPSSFIVNDFQFSIINGHYENDITIINRDKTVSQSIVNKIVESCDKYHNIIVSYEKEYYDKEHKFHGKELKSDIDVSLYDSISNTVLIIECKWKEKLYIKGQKYDKVCDDVNKIFKNQLNKHKYFLELSTNNIDFIFNNNEKVKKRPYYPSVMYIMVDKRVQIHYDNKHVLSEFNFLKLIKDSAVNNILKLDEVISKINKLETKVEEVVKEPLSILHYKDEKIQNSLFNLLINIE